MLDEWPEANNQFFPWRQVFFQSHPRARPVVQIAADGGSIAGRRRARRLSEKDFFEREINKLRTESCLQVIDSSSKIRSLRQPPSSAVYFASLGLENCP